MQRFVWGKSPGWWVSKNKIFQIVLKVESQPQTSLCTPPALRSSKQMAECLKDQHSSIVTQGLNWRIKSHLQLRINTRINNDNEVFSPCPFRCTRRRTEGIMRCFNAALFSLPYLTAITITSCVWQEHTLVTMVTKPSKSEAACVWVYCLV